MRFVLRVFGIPVISLALEGLSLALDGGDDAVSLGSDLSFGFSPDPVFPEDEAYEEEDE